MFQHTQKTEQSEGNNIRSTGCHLSAIYQFNRFRKAKQKVAFIIRTYLGNEARKSARSFVNRSVIEPNCFRVISQSECDIVAIGFL